KWVKKGLQFKMIKSVDFDDPEKMAEYDAYILNSGRTKFYLEGWNFRHLELAKKYRKVYQRLFAPDVDKVALEKNYLAKSEGQLLIAVHIRRGDYKEFLDGKYFYDDAVYIRKIQELLAILDKEYKLIIFTNDAELNEAVYRNQFSNVIVSRNNVKTDHYLMSQCDYILGPPSTFSLWASFMGDRPYYHIDDPKEIITADKFQITFA
ncbi:alpha-1,2-fucosyltransferase, partial [Chitinophaga sp.]|uniref:alpha-1,2-fucosyltransferase n=1 Tax=Chitinophaga sp. TaxID=1869181 RepID=UPI002F9561C0